jgi:hypothetical protein
MAVGHIHPLAYMVAGCTLLTLLLPVWWAPSALQPSPAQSLCPLVSRCGPLTPESASRDCLIQLVVVPGGSYNRPRSWYVAVPLGCGEVIALSLARWVVLCCLLQQALRLGFVAGACRG